MRAFLSAGFAAVALCLSPLAAAQTTEVAERLSARDIGDFLRTLQKPGKPGDDDGFTSPAGYSGDDSCQWANDNECDDPGIGTGACPEFTDYSDCWRIATGVEDDTCQWANDGECDEPGLGTGACPQATDYSDCADLVHLRGRNDQCDLAFNGVCNEDEGGDGVCDGLSDRSDCVGRERPLTISDHYFGYDDRVLLDTGVFPWSVIGTIEMETSGTCTATLVAPDILITAAHCISNGRGIDARGIYTTGENLPGGPRTARIIDYFMDPDWDEQRFNSTDDIDYVDWALLRLDTRLGDELGHARPGAMGDYLASIGANAALAEQRRAKPGAPPEGGLLQLAGPSPSGRSGDFTMVQGGYSWDTGTNLSGNLDCEVVQLFRNATMAHDCDTTRGDSGSPFMVRDGDDYFVLATDSNFRENPDGPMLYIAVRSEAWLDYFDDFAAGRIGNGGPRPGGPGKPDKR